MKRQTSSPSRSRVEQLLSAQAPAARESLPDGFARRTMAAVRCAKARQGQQEASAVHGGGFMPAAIALASLVVLAWFAASLPTQAPEPEPDSKVAQQDVPTVPALDDAQSAPIVLARGSLHFADPLVAPIRSEVEALLDTGRDLGVTMLSALPAQPRAWSQHLEEQPGR